MGFEERRIGSVIGKWRVDSLLGSGSMAAVYAVTHRNGSRAALKILHGQLANDDAVVERFLSEGYLANVVKHPGIVRVFDDGMTDEGCPFLAMEMLEGETLEDYREAAGPKLSLETTISIIDAIMDVLAAVHAGNVIHRDLKPSNVFLTADRQIKLLDFGVAKLSDKKSVSKLSLVGMVLGTPAYMAPEQALGAREAVDSRSDIFAVGAIMFTMLTGEHVHPVEGTQQKLLAAATAKARSLGAVMPELPPGIVAVVDQALQFKKDDRWQTITQMRNALKEASALARNASMRPPPPSTTRLSSTERNTDGTLVNVEAPTMDGAPSEPAMPAAPPPREPGIPVKTLLGISAYEAKPAPPGPPDIVPGRRSDLETTQIGVHNPYGLVAPTVSTTEGQVPMATASGQYLAVPQVSDSGRAGFFYGKDKPPSSSNIDITGLDKSGEWGKSGNGSYPSGAETPIEPDGIPRRPLWPVALGLAALVALVAGAGVYMKASRAAGDGTQPSATVPSASASVPHMPLGVSATALPKAPSATASAVAPVVPAATTAAAPKATWAPPQGAAPAPAPSKSVALPLKPADLPKPAGPTPPDIEIIE